MLWRNAQPTMIRIERARHGRHPLLCDKIAVANITVSFLVFKCHKWGRLELRVAAESPCLSNKGSQAMLAHCAYWSSSLGLRGGWRVFSCLVLSAVLSAPSRADDEPPPPLLPPAAGATPLSAQIEAEAKYVEACGYMVRSVAQAARSTPRPSRSKFRIRSITSTPISNGAASTRRNGSRRIQTTWRAKSTARRS